mgnify:CR=1 FL=1|jgi:hypothetical protein
MRRATNRTFLALLMLAGVSPAQADPLSDLLKQDDGAACFERIYDDAHLARNPRQRTRSVLMSLKEAEDGGGTVIRIRFQRTDGERYVVGTCEWANPANLDTMGEKMIPAFRGPGGLDCHAATDVDGMSAEEGGDFPVDLRDGTVPVLYMPEDIAAWRSIDRPGNAEFLPFGTDDNVFRMDRTDAGACRVLVDALPWFG